MTNFEYIKCFSAQELAYFCLDYVILSQKKIV